MKIIRWCLISKIKRSQSVLKKVLSLIVFSRSACAKSFADWMWICICRSCSCVTNGLIQPIGIRHKKGCLASIRNLHKFNILWEWKWWSCFQWQRIAEVFLVGPSRRSDYAVFDLYLHHFYFRNNFLLFLIRSRGKHKILSSVTVFKFWSIESNGSKTEEIYSEIVR